MNIHDWRLSLIWLVIIVSMLGFILISMEEIDWLIVIPLLVGFSVIINLIASDMIKEYKKTKLKKH